MSEAAGDLNLERLLTDALRPVDPPADLSTRVESTLSAIAEQAAAELSSWADELSEGELEALRDPRNWVRPVAAVAVGGAAAGALVLVEMRRRRRPTRLPPGDRSPASRPAVAHATEPLHAGASCVPVAFRSGRSVVRDRAAGSKGVGPKLCPFTPACRA